MALAAKISEKKDRKEKNGRTFKEIHFRIFIVIIITVILIVVSSLVVGALFLTSSITSIIPVAIITMILSVVAAYIASTLLKRPFQEIDHLRRAAEVASISKSTFLANMSHEIRTPMNSIIGFSELAMDDEIPPRTKECLGKVLENAEGLLQIINDVLDLSKVESGKIVLEKIPFSMHELFASCRILILPKAVEKGIMLYFYAEPSIGKMPVGDPTRLRQVLVNLLSNAVKFTNVGIVKLLAMVKEKKDNTIKVYFEVKDSGIGMSDEQIARIFDPFMQAETGTTRKYGGTGLGLAITKNIVELMGGKLTVESTHDVGSRFTFELSFDTIDAADDDSLNKKIIFNEMEKPIFSGEILVCEDNVMNQEVVCEQLARIGLNTAIAGNGKIGLDLVQQRINKGEKQFDLIFMDMHMPVMDGLEACEKILKLNSNIPIVAMTANIMPFDREIYRRSGMADCVGKPFTSQELWRCLMKYFNPIRWEPVKGSRHSQVETEMLRKLINTFVKNNKNRFNEIKEAVNAGDIQHAHRLAHSLKSNAGQLGKTVLQGAAANVEYHLENGKNLVTDDHLYILETELNEVINQFSEELKKDHSQSGQFSLKSSDFLPESVSPNAVDNIANIEGSHLDSQDVLKLLEQLDPLLKACNPECHKLIDSLSRIPGSEELIQKIEYFDFELACTALASLRKKLKMY